MKYSKHQNTFRFVQRQIRSCTYFLVCMLFAPLILTSQISNGYTLIVGLKTIDEVKYSKKEKYFDNRATAGVDKDIKKMKRIAKENKHNITVLQNERATKQNILNAITDIGKKIKQGDYFLFYFSGHGDIKKDENNDELSGYDQTLVAYDDFVIDDEIYSLLNQYFILSKNIMIVDACHSSTTYKYASFVFDVKSIFSKVRSFSNESITKNQRINTSDCDFESDEKVDETFNLIYFGATEDNDDAIGNIHGGILTYWLDRIISSANFNMNWNQYTYKRLACELKKQLKDQKLQYHEIGKSVFNYSNNKPFKIY